MTNVAEGVVTAPVVSELANKYGVETPISDQVTAVISGEITAADAYDVLLLREQRPEH